MHRFLMLAVLCAGCASSAGAPLPGPAAESAPELDGEELLAMWGRRDALTDLAAGRAQIHEWGEPFGSRIDPTTGLLRASPSCVRSPGDQVRRDAYNAVMRRAVDSGEIEYLRWHRRLLSPTAVAAAFETATTPAFDAEMHLGASSTRELIAGEYWTDRYGSNWLILALVDTTTGDAVCTIGVRKRAQVAVSSDRRSLLVRHVYENAEPVVVVYDLATGTQFQSLPPSFGAAAGRVPPDSREPSDPPPPPDDG